MSDKKTILSLVPESVREQLISEVEKLIKKKEEEYSILSTIPEDLHPKLIAEVQELKQKKAEATAEEITNILSHIM